MKTKIVWHALAVVVIIAALAVACNAESKGHANRPEQVTPYLGFVWRWHDPAYAVTCWVTPQGISCLPDAAFE